MYLFLIAKTFILRKNIYCSLYDVIHVGAAAPEVPKYLIDQLKLGGRMIIPVGDAGETQVFQQWDKDERGEVSHKDLMHVMYVPLTDTNTQLGF